MPVVIICLIIKVKDLLNSFLVNFSSLLDIPSCPELFLFSRLSIAFKVSVSVIHLNWRRVFAGTPMHCEKFIVLSNCVSISEARFAPILAKYKLNVFAISLEFDRDRPLCSKLGGKSHFFLFRLRVSLIVRHVFFISVRYAVNIGLK